MLLKFFVDSAKEKVTDLLYYYRGVPELESLVSDKMTCLLQNVEDELIALSKILEFE